MRGRKSKRPREGDDPDRKKEKQEARFKSFLDNTDEKDQIVSGLHELILYLIYRRKIGNRPFKIVELGCGTGDIPDKLVRSFQEDDRQRPMVVYSGIDINGRYLAETETRLTVLGVPHFLKQGDCFNASVVGDFFQEDTDLVLMSHVAYWGNISDIAKLAKARSRNAVVVMIHQHSDSLPNCLRRELEADVNTEITKDIAKIMLEEEYYSSEFVIPSVASLKANTPKLEGIFKFRADKRPSSNVKSVGEYSDSQETQYSDRICFSESPLYLRATVRRGSLRNENIDSQMTCSSGGCFPSSPLSEVTKDTRNLVEFTIQHSMDSITDSQGQKTYGNIRDHKVNGGIVFWDHFQIYTSDIILAYIINRFVNQFINCLQYYGGSLETFAMLEENFRIFHTLQDLRRQNTEWYTEDRINQLLRAHLNKEHYAVIAQTQLENEGALIDNLRAAIGAVMTGQVAVIPINLHNNHWVGVVIRMQEGGRIQAIYADPTGNTIEQEENAVVFVEALQGIAEELTQHIPDILVLHVQQQTNGNDCGPFTVDNLIRLAQVNLDGMNRTMIETLLNVPEDGNALEIRQQHLAELQLEDGNVREIQVANSQQDVENHTYGFSQDLKGFGSNPFVDESPDDFPGRSSSWILMREYSFEG